MKHIYLYLFASFLFLAMTDLYGMEVCSFDRDPVEYVYCGILQETSDYNYHHSIKRLLTEYQNYKENEQITVDIKNSFLALSATLNPKYAINNELIYDAIANFPGSSTTLIFMYNNSFFNGKFCNDSTLIGNKPTLKNFLHNKPSYNLQQLLEQYTLHLIPEGSIKDNVEIFINLLKTNQALRKKIVAFEIDCANTPPVFTIYPTSDIQDTQTLVNALYAAFKKTNTNYVCNAPENTQRLGDFLCYEQDYSAIKYYNNLPAHKKSFYNNCNLINPEKLLSVIITLGVIMYAQRK